MGKMIITSDKLKERMLKELLKFSIDADSGKYSADTAALSFEEANISSSPESRIKIVVLENGDLIVTYGGVKVPEDLVLRLLDNVMINNRKIEQAPAAPEVEINIEQGGLFEESVSSGIEEAQAAQLNNALQSAAAASENISVSANKLISSPAEDQVRFVDSVRSLCSQIAVELESDIQQVEIVEQLPEEEQQSNQAIVVAARVNNAANSANRERLIGISISRKAIAEKLNEREKDDRPGKPPRPIPAQIRKMASGEPTFAVFDDNASICVYGGLHEIKREIFAYDEEKGVILDRPSYETVTIGEILEGLPDGKYITSLYEDSEMGIVSLLVNQPAEEFFFKIENPKPAAPEKVEIKVEEPDKDSEMEAKAEEVIKEAKKEPEKAREQAQQDNSAEARRERQRERERQQQEMIEKLLHMLPQGERDKMFRHIKDLFNNGLDFKSIMKDLEKYVRGYDAQVAARKARSQQQAAANRQQAQQQAQQAQQQAQQAQQQAAPPPADIPAPGGPGGGGQGPLGGGY
jgi:hypothetical protein